VTTNERDLTLHTEGRSKALPAPAEKSARWAFVEGQTKNMTADALALSTVDPMVCHGQACVKGTRIPVSVVLDCLGDGMSAEQIIDQYRFFALCVWQTSTASSAAS